MTLFLFFLVTFVAGIAGGTLSGIALAGKDLGNQTAALFGSLFGGAIAFPAALASAIVVFLVKH